MLTQDHHDDDSDLIAVIQLLHKQCQPPAKIAAELHIDEPVVRFVIQRSRFPRRPLEWNMDR